MEYSSIIIGTGGKSDVVIQQAGVQLLTNCSGGNSAVVRQQVGVQLLTNFLGREQRCSEAASNYVICSGGEQRCSETASWSTTQELPVYQR